MLDIIIKILVRLFEVAIVLGLFGMLLWWIEIFRNFWSDKSGPGPMPPFWWF